MVGEKLFYHILMSVDKSSKLIYCENNIYYISFLKKESIIMDIILYSTHCPKCNILAAKMKAKNIGYVENNDVEEMKKLGLMSVPYLSVDGELMDFGAAIKWINNKEAETSEEKTCISCRL